jgi:gamma-glutamyltranspeptidase/glutathione hydrolase
VLLGMVEDGLDPQAALDRPRFCLNAEAEAGQVALEDGLPLETIEELSALGHQVNVVRGMERSVFGRGQVIRRDPESGVLWGGSDPRADGCAMAVI